MTFDFRKRLLDMQAELRKIEQPSGASAAIVELDQAKVGRLSRMDAMQAQAMAQASSGRQKAMLGKITAALQRLDDGDYGDCRGCDEPIDPRRLQVDPTATLCITCANRSEQ